MVHNNHIKLASYVLCSGQGNRAFWIYIGNQWLSAPEDWKLLRVRIFKYKGNNQLPIIRIMLSMRNFLQRVIPYERWNTIGWSDFKSKHSLALAILDVALRYAASSPCKLMSAYDGTASDDPQSQRPPRNLVSRVQYNVGKPRVGGG